MDVAADGDGSVDNLHVRLLDQQLARLMAELADRQLRDRLAGPQLRDCAVREGGRVSRGLYVSCISVSRSHSRSLSRSLSSLALTQSLTQSLNHSPAGHLLVEVTHGRRDRGFSRFSRCRCWWGGGRGRAEARRVESSRRLAMLCNPSPAPRSDICATQPPPRPSRPRPPHQQQQPAMDAPEDRDVKLQKVSADLLTQFGQRLPEFLRAVDRGEGEGRRWQNSVESLVALVRQHLEPRISRL